LPEQGEALITVRIWKAFLLSLILGMASIPPAALAQPSAPPRSADEVLAHANAMIAGKDYEGAIALLQSAIARYPTQLPMYLLLADCQEMKGLSALRPAENMEVGEAFRRQLNQGEYVQLARDLFETYGKATMYVPEIRPVQQRVADLLTTQFPVLLGEYGPLALPGDPLPCLTTITDPQLPTEARGVYQGLITTRPLPVTPPYFRDPKYGADNSYDADPTFGHWTFQQMLLAYEFDREQRCWRLRFRVIWQDAPDQGDQRLRLAKNCATLLLRLSCLLRAYTGMTPRFTNDGVINIWLTEKGVPGGETYDDSIYLYNAGMTRTPPEWVRELAHEYGHEVLPPVGGYAKPEWGANGYLGERLFLRWLLLNRDTKSDSHTWVRALDAREIIADRIDQMIRRFAAIGPDSQVLTGTDKAAMDGFIGMACYLEISRGSQYLATLLAGLSTPTFGGPQGFLETLAKQESYYQDPEHALVSLRLTGLPADTPLWVYLSTPLGKEATAWKGEVTGGGQLKVEVDGKEVKSDGNTFITPALDKGWHSIAITATEPPAMSGLKLVRQ